LQQTLEEEKEADQTLTDLAEKINETASAKTGETEGRKGPRTRRAA
jgi:ferritin-like metal-binding protein YciE